MGEGVTYIAGEDVPDAWNCYPWDAAAYGNTIQKHEEIARSCAGEPSRHAEAEVEAEERLFAFKLGLGLAVASIFLGSVAWKTCVDQASYAFSWASVKAADEKRALQLSKLCAACTEVVHGNRTLFSLDEHLANGSCSVL